MSPYKHGRDSQREIATLHPDLRVIVLGLIEVYDHSVEGGARTVDEQIGNIRRRVSKTLDSRHIPRDENGLYDPSMPSIAVDLVPWQQGVNPWPQDDDTPKVRAKLKGRFYFMQGIVRQIAHSNGIEIRQGQDWDRDNDFLDQSFDDLPHLELWIPSWPKLIVEGELLERANEALTSRGLPAYG